MRNQARGPTPVTDNRRTLYGLLTAGIPAINSLESVYQDLERAAMVAELKAIERRVGHDKFPLVPITYYEVCFFFHRINEAGIRKDDCI